MTDTSTYKARLDAELSQVEAELRTVGRTNPSNPADWEPTAGDIDQTATEPDETADKIEGYEENAGILKNLEIRWNNIKRALGKIEKGTYGVCEISGEPIEEARLNANPAARTCTAHLGEEESLP